MMEKQEDQTPKKPDSEKGIIKDIYDHIKERMSGSFLPAFIISFMAVNWQFFYITFFVSEEYIYKMKINKIQYIYEMYNRLNGRDYYGWYLIGGPLLGVLLYYFAIPFFDELIKITKYQLSIDYFPNKVKGRFRDDDYKKLKDINYPIDMFYKIIINGGSYFHKNLDNEGNLQPIYFDFPASTLKTMNLINYTYKKRSFIVNNHESIMREDTLLVPTIKGEYIIDKYLSELSKEEIRGINFW